MMGFLGVAWGPIGRLWGSFDPAWGLQECATIIEGTSADRMFVGLAPWERP